MRKLLLAISACFVFTSGLVAQHYRCGTDLMYNRAKARNPLLVEAQHNYEALMREEMIEFRQNRDGETEAVLVIPMVFHILHLNGSENISDEQIYNQMEILNRDYNKLNADTILVVDGLDTLIANVKLEFRLATKDFLGNCTNGIERIHTIEALVGDNGSKLNQWPRERYLNVWTVARIESGAAGYSQYPSAVIDELSARADGVLILHNYIGSIETGSEGQSRALTHEIGHYLDLAHPWGSTNEPGVECGDDGVADTPITEGFDLQCILNDYSCSATITQGLVYDFDDVNAGSGGTTDPTVNPGGLVDDETNPRMILGNFIASGVSANPVADSIFSYSNWSTGGVDQSIAFSDMTGTINTQDYYEFTISPTIGSGMSLTDLKFSVKRSATGPRNFSVRSSVNNFATNLSANIGPASPLCQVLTAPNPTNAFFFSIDSTALVTGCKVTVSGAQYTNITEPVTFRVYAWNAEDAFGSFGIENLEVVGNYGQIENAQNYMDYSYCSVMFTDGQKERMRLALTTAISGRDNLTTELNRQLTGTDDNPLTCAPMADFYPVSKFACLGENIQFRNNSTNGVVDSYLWTFQDGNPATSTEENPTVSFTAHGRKSVTLTVTNEQGSNTKTIEQSVVIAPDNTEFAGGLIQEGFNSFDEFYNLWVGENYDNNSSSWQQTSTAGFSNGTSAKLNAYNMDATFIDEGGNDIDELVSPSMDLSNVDDNAVITFKWAYATQSVDLAGITDRLVVQFSNNCGKTWSSAELTIEGLDLVTSGSVAIPFSPTQADQWQEASVEIPGSYYNDGFRMKFTFFAGLYPNNLYLDDINMTAITKVDEVNADFYGARLFPNPSEGMTTLAYSTNGATEVQITLTDMSGRVVRNWTPNNNTPGKQTLDIPTAELAKGVYMVNLSSAKNNTTLKLMVK